MTRWWYTKLFLIVTLGLAAFIVVWPSLETLVGLKVPPFVKKYLLKPDTKQDPNKPAGAPKEESYRWQINRGLDLRGGLRLVYTVQVDEAIRDKRDRYADEIRQKLANTLGLRQGDAPLTADDQAKLNAKVTFERPEYNKIRMKFVNADDSKKIDDKFNENFSADMILSRPEAAVVQYKVRTEAENAVRERAVSQAKKTVENRVDELGLREASITTRDEDIIIEVPGENEKVFAEIEQLVSQTAKLEFKILDDEADFIGKLDEKQYPLPEGGSTHAERAPNGPNKETRSTFVRIVKKPDEKSADLYKRARAWAGTLPIPDDHQLAWGEFHDADPVTKKQVSVGLRSYYLHRRADVTGDYITDAQVSMNQDKGPTQEYHVAITFSPVGAERFKTVTGLNVEKRFAIMLDEKVDSAPVIQTEIGGGHAQISLGSFSDRREQLEAAKKLELVLRAGALPAPLEQSNKQHIGASLGEDAIKEGLKGALLGSALVLLFMLVYYRWAGAIADGAVLYNLLIQLAALALFGASMTLPGIGGLALTIGMAVDANVLINERIREELREGRSPRAAVEAGYGKAFNSILDGHVTTFIGGLLLLQYGTGPIKGFAVTLIIGIVTSLFCSIVCTRIVFDWWVLGRRVKRLSLGQGS